jgi:hypothetical protein
MVCRVMHLNEQLIDQGSKQSPEARGHEGHPPPATSSPATTATDSMKTLMVLLIVATPFFYYCILSLEVALDYCD